jgi:hypothetical protein
MLGRVAEAEDIVEENLRRVHRSIDDGERIEKPSPVSPQKLDTERHHCQDNSI